MFLFNLNNSNFIYNLNNYIRDIEWSQMAPPIHIMIDWLIFSNLMSLIQKGYVNNKNTNNQKNNQAKPLDKSNSSPLRVSGG
jgi:hypothetical protein